MIKLIVLYNHPEDPEAFDEHYLNVHVPLARQIPHLHKLEITKIESVRGGDKPPYHMVAELWYEDEAAMAAAAASPEFATAQADQPNFNTAGSVAWICRVVD